MPLTPDPNQRYSNADLFSVRFPMFDGTKQVTCVVTSEALQDLAALDGSPSDKTIKTIERLFESYRSEVEEIASDKYDAGDLDERRSSRSEQRCQSGVLKVRPRARLPRASFRFGPALPQRRSADWRKSKNPACEAVRREVEEDWGR